MSENLSPIAATIGEVPTSEAQLSFPFSFRAFSLFLHPMQNFDLSTYAKEQGWALAGACPPEIPRERQDFYRRWIETECGPEMGYLKRRTEERLDPKKYFEAVKSILCFAHYYFPGWSKESIKVSNYAWGEDYHSVLKEKLELTATSLQKVFGNFKYRTSVDTSPILEKVLAAEAGLGWQGKNTLLIHPQFGSALFLGEIFTDIPLEAFQSSSKMKDHCGNCRRCIEACPTDALEAYELNSKLCISYWTLEHKSAFTSETPKWKEWVAGCDICQSVCPWNQKLLPSTDAASEPQIHPQELEKLREKGALRYLKLGQLERNKAHILTGESPFSA